MGYNEDLERLLAKIEMYESLKDVGKLKSTETTNEILKKLSIGEWRVCVNDRFRWEVVAGEDTVGDYSELRIEPFEDFKATLMDVITHALLVTQPYRYSRIRDFEEKAVNTAIELANKIDEDLYEDLMVELRKIKESGAREKGELLKTRLAEYNKALWQAVRAVAKEWLKENLAPGVFVSFRHDCERASELYGSKWRIKKLVKLGSTTALALEGTDYIVTDLRDLDSFECWRINTSEATDIIDRIANKE